ncbi:mitochondrial ribosome-associated GTPase 1-like, partial [Saccostrea cucullata]|uniref:mitochondrial ribosome-associated GTPase 1-like n=1 Tax=Saccostrea cuccullata TaxID=36930 RepID=UPI002ED06396
IHDARIPFSGRTPLFKDMMKMKAHVLLLNKCDVADMSRRRDIVNRLKEGGVDKVLFTNLTSEKSKVINQELFPLVVEAIHSAPRFNRETAEAYEMAVIGVPNVGKSTFINYVRRSHTTLKKRPLRVGAVAGVTRSLSGKIRANFDPPVYLTDTPGILTPQVSSVEEGMKLALCGCLPDHIVGEDLIVDFMLFWFNKHSDFRYMEQFHLSEPTDDVQFFLNHIAKENKFIKRLKSVDSRDYNYFPDYLAAARLVLKQFRDGAIGPMLLEDL